MIDYQDNTRLIDLTVGDLKRLVASLLVPAKEESVTIIKGIGNMAKELGLSNSYVAKLKADGALEGAYTQRGRTILFNKEKVINRLHHEGIN
jgi:hypothetical protein